LKIVFIKTPPLDNENITTKALNDLNG